MAGGQVCSHYRFWKELTLRGVGDSIRCSSLEGSFSLWEEYIQEARHHVAALGENALEVCYEDFLAEPAPHLKAMVEFCGLHPSEDAVVAMTSKVRKDRAHAFLKDPELVAFADSVAHRLAAQGYKYP